MANVPNLLSGLRLALMPVLLALAWTAHPRIFLAALVISLLTDLADGLLARKLHLTTQLGAKLDSWADFLTYLSLPVCGWWLRPDVLREEALWLGAGIACYLAAILIGFLKFRVLTSYHTWGAKAAAIIVGATVFLFFVGSPGWLFRIVMPFVVLTNLEEIAITTVLPQARPNVPSLWHALRYRRSLRQAPSPASAHAR